MHGKTRRQVDGTGRLPDAALLIRDGEDPAGLRPGPRLAVRPSVHSGLSRPRDRRIRRRIPRAMNGHLVLTLSLSARRAGITTRDHRPVRPAPWPAPRIH